MQSNATVRLKLERFHFLSLMVNSSENPRKYALWTQSFDQAMQLNATRLKLKRILHFLSPVLNSSSNSQKNTFQGMIKNAAEVKPERFLQFLEQLVWQLMKYIILRSRQEKYLGNNNYHYLPSGACRRA